MPDEFKASASERDADIFEEDPEESMIEAVKSEAMVNREAFEQRLASMKDVWGYSETGLEAKRAAMSMLSTKTGMYARIPLRCKGEECPYHDSCALIEYSLTPVGEPCPVETAQIETRYAGYMQDFDLDMSSFTDKNMVSEIINYDIMIERCKALIAKEGVPVIDVVAGISESGEEYTQPQVSKFLEAHDKLVRRRNEIYQLMMATRRDKKDQNANDSKTVIQYIKEIQEGDGFVIEERPDEFKDS